MDASNFNKPMHTALILGDGSVGKTTFLKTITNSNPDRHFVLVDKVQNTSITLKADEGSPEGRTQNALCIIFMYDITATTTLSKLAENYSNLLKDKDLKERCFLVLLGNKSDLENQRKVQAQEGELFASQYGMFFLEVSCATRKNIELLQKVIRIRASHLLKKKDISEPAINTEKSDIQPQGSNFIRAQTTIEDDKKTAALTGSAEMNKQSPQRRSHYQLNLKNREVERRERWAKLESSAEKNRANTPLSDICSTEGNRQSTSPGNRRQTTSPGKDSCSDLFPMRVTPRREEKPTQPLHQNLYSNGSMRSHAQEFVGERQFEPLRNNEFQHQPYSRDGMSPMLDKSPQSRLEQARAVQNAGSTAYQKQQENLYDTEQSRTQPPMPSPSNLDEWSKEPPLSSTKRSLSSQNTKREDSSRRQFSEKLTMPSSVSSSSLLNSIRKDHSQATPQFREKPGQSMSAGFQNQSHTNAQQYLRNPPNSNSSEDRVEPVSLPRPNTNREHNNVSFSQKGHNQAAESRGVQPNQNNRNFVENYKATSSPFTNRGLNGRATEDPRPEEYYQRGTTNQYSRNIERREYRDSVQRTAGNQGSPLKQPENINSIKFTEDFQFISTGNSDNGSILRRYDHQEGSEAPQYNASNKRQPILSEIDQNIKRLEASLSSINTKMAEQGRTSRRGVYGTTEKDIFNRKTENHNLREMEFPDENDFYMPEERGSTHTLQTSKSLSQFHKGEKSPQQLYLNINPRKTLNFDDIRHSHRKDGEDSRPLSAERKLSNNSTLKKEKTYSYLRKKNTTLEQKSTLMDGSNGFGNRNNKPILYIHLENAQGNISVVPVYSEDSPLTVAERYLEQSGCETTREKLQKLAELIEDKINAASFEVETYITQHEEQATPGKGTPNTARLESNLKKGKNFNFGTAKRTPVKKQEDVLIGKLYVELENRRIVVLNLRQRDDLSDAAVTFMNTHSLSKQYYQLIYTHLQQLKQMAPKNLEFVEESYPILNLVLKDCKFANRKSLSPVPSRVSVDETRASTPSRNSTMRKSNSILCKLNVDTGNGRISKMIVKEGDNLKRVAHNFVITHKMGPGAFDKVFQLLQNAAKNKAGTPSSGKNTNRLFY